MVLNATAHLKCVCFLQPSEGDNLEVHETALLERDELVSLLKTVNEVNKARGGCQFVCKVIEHSDTIDTLLTVTKQGPPCN